MSGHQIGGPTPDEYFGQTFGRKRPDWLKERDKEGVKPTPRPSAPISVLTRAAATPESAPTRPEPRPEAKPLSVLYDDADDFSDVPKWFEVDQPDALDIMQLLPSDDPMMIEMIADMMLQTGDPARGPVGMDQDPLTPLQRAIWW